MSRIAVVGAGIAGLTIAFRLRAAHDVTVFESAAVAGGKIHSESIDGYLFEWGPTGFLSRAAELVALARDAGLADEVTEANAAAAKRFIYWNGALHALPTKPPGMLAMNLLSPWGKVRALGDLFARSPAPSTSAATDRDESVYAFARRHFGREVAERIVAPALLGVSSGDAASTSVSSMFPRLRELERAHGSVIRGMISSRATPGRLSAFGPAGMQRLTDRLAELLGSRMRYATPVARLEPIATGGWRVHAGGEALEVDTVIVTAPADAAATMLAACDAPLADELRGIPYAPMRVVGVGFRAADVSVPLDGFGFLAARGAGVRILGALYTSTIADGQSPPGTVYLRTFLGGTTDPAALDLDADAARAIVLADLATTLGIRAEPIAYHEVVWPRAIPQYQLDHPARLARIDERVALHAGLVLGGNAYRGLGVGDTVNDAVAIANRLR